MGRQSTTSLTKTATPVSAEPPAPIWPHYDAEQISAVTRVLESGRVNAWTGPDVREFELAFAEMTGAAHAIAVANGSVSLNLAMECLGIRPGDEVIVSPRSFVVSASAVVRAGGTPIFADVDRDTQNITPETVAPLITDRTVGILPVHLAGWPCDMDGFVDLANKHDLWIVEDCAQAHGATIHGRHVGTFGDFGSFSFCQDKIISTGGEGGMLITNSSALWKNAWSRKDHGKDYELVYHGDHPPGFRWLHASPGTNLRMSGMAAAIGRIQVERLPEWHNLRTRNAAVLASMLADCPALRVPYPGNAVRHAWYRFYAFVRPERLKPGWSRDRIMTETEARGQTIFSGSCPEIYREKVFQTRGFGPAHPLPVAKELGQTSLAFRVDPTLDEKDMQAVGSVVRDVLDLATL